MMRRAVFTLRSHRIAVAAVACCVLLAACGGGGGGDGEGSGGASTSTGRHDGTTVAPTRAGQALEWSACGDIECATLEVPVDHADPAGPTLDLALGRRRAKGDRIGTLLVNPGGPGAAGIPLVQDAESYFSNALLDRFDIVAWDPRGSGDSTAIDCGNKLDYFFDTDKSPDDPAEVAANVAAARKLANACEERSARAAAAPVVECDRRRHGRDPRRARRGEAHVSRLLLRHLPRRALRRSLSHPRAGARPRRRARSVARLRGRHARPGGRLRQRAERVPRQLRAHQVRIRWQRSAPRLRPPDRPDRRGAVARRGRRRARARSGPAKPISASRARSTRERRAGASSRTRSSAPARGDGTTLLQLSDAYTGRKPGGTLRQLAGRVLRHRLPRRAGTDDRTAAGGRAADRAGRAGVRRVDHVVVVAVLGVAGARRRVSPRRCTARAHRRSWCSARRTIPRRR